MVVMGVVDRCSDDGLMMGEFMRVGGGQGRN